MDNVDDMYNMLYDMSETTDQTTPEQFTAKLNCAVEKINRTQRKMRHVRNKRRAVERKRAEENANKLKQDIRPVFNAHPGYVYHRSFLPHVYESLY